MKTGRLEAFSDGVLAIIITIMVLELKVPHEPTLAALLKISPIFISYLVSFLYVAIYWNSHHHLFQVVEKLNGKILWANLHLLFWLSLIPFATSWIGENHVASIPVAFYGFVLFMSAIAFVILSKSISIHHGKGTEVYNLTNIGLKERLSLLAYVVGILLAYVNPYLGILCYILVAGAWFIPSRKFEEHKK